MFSFIDISYFLISAVFKIFYVDDLKGLKNDDNDLGFTLITFFLAVFILVSKFLSLVICNYYGVIHYKKHWGKGLKQALRELGSTKIVVKENDDKHKPG